MDISNESTYRLLVWAALATFIIAVGATTYRYIAGGSEAGNLEYRTGNLRLEDGEYVQALGEFDTALKAHPSHAPSHLGRALALMALERRAEAMEAFNTALALDPDFAAAYANRGILNDRMGNYSAAIQDYRKALALDATMGEGPGWITRFFRMQYKRPPTIADRASYLESELQKPAEQRKLHDLDRDRKQRMYKMEAASESNATQ
jgi:tetratricopeptide (TPR) repeat protein